jgi:hypothetical protein
LFTRFLLRWSAAEQGAAARGVRAGAERRAEAGAGGGGQHKGRGGGGGAEAKEMRSNSHWIPTRISNTGIHITGLPEAT